MEPRKYKRMERRSDSSRVSILSSIGQQSLEPIPRKSEGDIIKCKNLDKVVQPSKLLELVNPLVDLDMVDGSDISTTSLSPKKVNRVGVYAHRARDGSIRKREKIFKIIQERDQTFEDEISDSEQDSSPAVSGVMSTLTGSRRESKLFDTPSQRTPKVSQIDKEVYK